MGYLFYKVKKGAKKDMKRTLKLDFPIRIDGKDVTELDYDFTKITVEHFMQASMKSADMTKAQALNI